VFDVVAPERPDLRTEADEVLLDLEAVRSRDQVVPGFMDQDDEEQTGEEDDDRDGAGHGYRSSMISAARCRAQRSVRSMLTIETTDAGSRCVTHSLHTTH